MRNFHYPKSLYESEGLNPTIILELVKDHYKFAQQKLKCLNYYEGNPTIPASDNESRVFVPTNIAKHIADTSAGYFLGSPISYHADTDVDISPLIEAFDIAGVSDVDADNALNLAIFGISYEYIFRKEGESDLTAKVLSPTNCFIVTDDTIEENKLFAVYYYRSIDDVNNTITWELLVIDDTCSYNITIPDDENVQITMGEGVEHLMGQLPVIEILNNKFAFGDFELQIPLIDAYNELMSDRMTDKRQFIDAILVLSGVTLGDEPDEAMGELNSKKLLELPPDATASYLTRTLDEGGMEILRNSIKEDIYTMSSVPDFSDKNFAGNSSGVAMAYKLLGLELLAKTKERYYRKALKQRIAIFTHALNLTEIKLEARAVHAVFSRSLPQNLVELADIISKLKGLVSDETLIGLLPFVEDITHEINSVTTAENKTTNNEPTGAITEPDGAVQED